MEEDVINEVIWFDPGKTTGWASATTHSRNSDEIISFSSGQLTDLTNLREFLQDFFVHHGVDRLFVGWERYITTAGGGKSGTPRWAYEATGAIEQAVRQLDGLWPARLLTPQPASARRIATIEVLKELGWHQPGRPHANDAAMHLAAHFLRQRPVPSLLRDVFTKLLDEDRIATACEAPRDEETQ